MRNSVIELLGIVMICFIVLHYIIVAKYPEFYSLSQNYNECRKINLFIDAFLLVGLMYLP